MPKKPTAQKTAPRGKRSLEIITIVAIALIIVSGTITVHPVIRLTILVAIISFALLAAFIVAFKHNIWAYLNIVFLVLMLLASSAYLIGWTYDIIHICGDGRCGMSECREGCIRDCDQNKCIDSICETPIGESCQNSQDCECAPGSVCAPERNHSELKGCYQAGCGDNYCDFPLESKETCCADCGCEEGYSCISGRCQTVCGDHSCTGNETSSTCCTDCGCASGYNCINNACTLLAPEVSIQTSAPSEAFSSELYATSHYGWASTAINNNGLTPIYNLNIEFKVGSFTTESHSINQLNPGETETASWDPAFSNSILIKNGNTYTITVKLTYQDERGSQYEKTSQNEIMIKGYNAHSWNPQCLISAYVTSTDPLIRSIASSATSGIYTGTYQGKKQAARQLFESMQANNISYVTDPNDPIGGVDYVQLPKETWSNKGGDCDDLTTTYAALLESVGMETLLVQIPGHIFPCWFVNATTVECVESTMVSNKLASYSDAVLSGNSEYGTEDKTLIPVHTCWQTTEVLQPP